MSCLPEMICSNPFFYFLNLTRKQKIKNLKCLEMRQLRTNIAPNYYLRIEMSTFRLRRNSSNDITIIFANIVFSFILFHIIEI